MTLAFNSPVDQSIVDTAAGFHYSFATSEASLAASYAAAGTANTGQITYNTFGTDTAWGRILDKDGGFTDYSTLVTVKNVAPSNVTISGAPASSPEGTPISLPGNFADLGTGNTWTYDWTITDNGVPYTGPAGHPEFVGQTHVTGGHV